MVDANSEPSPVADAEAAVFGPIADAQALLTLYKNTSFDERTDSAFACLAMSVIERFTAAFDLYHVELLRHGRPPST